MYAPRYTITNEILKNIGVIEAGSLQLMEPAWLTTNCLITPHHQEFKSLFRVEAKEKNVCQMAQKYGCVILLKGVIDIVCGPQECRMVEGGNEGMTKGGTGDVLAGLVAALACKNEAFLAATCASYINKKAGESLFGRIGPYLNASDLCEEIPRVMNQLINK